MVKSSLTDNMLGTRPLTNLPSFPHGLSVAGADHRLPSDGGSVPLLFFFLRATCLKPRSICVCVGGVKHCNQTGGNYSNPILMARCRGRSLVFSCNWMRKTDRSHYLFQVPVTLPPLNCIRRLERCRRTDGGSR